MSKSIAIVGAGAKAAAIAARAAVLRDLLPGGGVPRIYVFEKEHAGAAWSGHGLHSSGFLSLCTPGEKDVGFPYDEGRLFGKLKAPLSPALFGRFSWSAYQVARGAMADWVDRGRDHPLHRQWAKYLQWVFDQAEQKVTQATVTRVVRAGTGWAVHHTEPGGQMRVSRVDGVVLTGTGSPNRVNEADGVPKGKVFDSETVWANRGLLQQLDVGTIAVAGDGGGAGAIVGWLAGQHAETLVEIACINRLGTLFPRGDGHAERRWFSDPTDWPSLSEDDRRKLVSRTEAGVVSMRLKSVIDKSTSVRYFRGKAALIRWDPDEGKLAVDLEYDGDLSTLEADYFISAIGYDRWSCLNLVDEPHVALVRDSDDPDKRETVERKLRSDLSLPDIYDLPPGLHVPSLAGVAHGPGMPNLGCLGLVAKAILQTYL